MIQRKVVAIVQTRLTSTRLPGKVLLDLAGKTVIELLFARLSLSSWIDQIVFAIPDTKENDLLATFFRETIPKCLVVRGSEHDVLSRYVMAIRQTDATHVARITSDCPFVDPRLVDLVIENLFLKKVDYSSNVRPPSFADGFDVEFMTREVLEYLDQKIVKFEFREHVTAGLFDPSNTPLITHFNLKNPCGDESRLRLTLDTSEDYSLMKRICLNLSFEQIVQLPHEELTKKVLKEVRSSRFL